MHAQLNEGIISKYLIASLYEIKMICYDHTCTAASRIWSTLCSIRGLCDDINDIGTARYQVPDIILGYISYVTINGPI